MSVEIAAPGSNAERSRGYNRGLVLRHIQRAGQAGRAEIARASGLSTQAVSNIISDLLSDGWVHAAGRRSGGRGLPAVTYAIRAEGGLAMGIEIRPGAVLGALIDLAGAVRWSERIALARATPDRVLPLARAMLNRACDAAARDRLIGAGVVMPGPFGHTGVSGQATDLPGWDGLDATATLSQALAVPVVVENDANAAAMAERLSGAAQGLSDFAYLYFGTGIGLGLVADGSLVRGAFGNAGEIGHIPVATPDGPRPLEDVASRLTLQRRLAANGRAIDTVDDLARVHADRPSAYEDWLQAAGTALGQAVQVVENLFDPEAVILGGAMPAEVLAEVIARIPLAPRSVANRAGRAQPRLLAGTAGRMTATIGAAALVVDAALSPRLSAAV